MEKEMVKVTGEPEFDPIEASVRMARFVSFPEDGDFFSSSDDTKKESVTEASEKDVMNQTVVNPDTGHKVKVKSALKYDKKSKVYKAAAAMLKKGGAKKDTPSTKKSSGGELDPEKFKKYVKKATDTLDKTTQILDTKTGKYIKFSDALKMDKNRAEYKAAYEVIKQKMNNYKTFESFSNQKKTALLNAVMENRKLEKKLAKDTPKAPKLDTFVSDEELTKMKVAPLWKAWDALRKCAESSGD